MRILIAELAAPILSGARHLMLSDKFAAALEFLVDAAGPGI